MKILAVMILFYLPILVTNHGAQNSKQNQITLKIDSKSSRHISDTTYSFETFQNTVTDTKTKFSKELIPLYLFSGICLIVFILTTAFAIYFREVQFIYYALYILLIFLFLSLEPLGFESYLFNGNKLMNLWFIQTLKVVFNIIYVLFCLYFIDVKRDYNSIFKLLMGIIYVELVFIVINSYVLFNEYYVLNKYLIHFHHLFFVFIPGIFCVLYVAIKSKNNLTYFVVIAATFYVLPFYPQYYIDFDSTLGKSFKDNNYFFIIGFSIEIIIFTFGLTYKILTDYKEKIRFQEKALMSETKALRAQINPHFIFNSLSSIQHLVTINDKASVLKYLSKFSRLTRNILESSIETNVVLNDEIKMLTDYLELESLRFNQAFTYNIKIDDNINANAVEIPFMILQPFVENAIIHGLLPKKEGNKNLSILFKKETNLICCEIDDNGIGRQASNLRTNIHKEDKKSRGMEVTIQRLKVYNANENSLRIIDKKDSSGKPLGTRVIIKIPI